MASPLDCSARMREMAVPTVAPNSWRPFLREGGMTRVDGGAEDDHRQRGVPVKHRHDRHHPRGPRRPGGSVEVHRRRGRGALGRGAAGHLGEHVDGSGIESPLDHEFGLLPPRISSMKAAPQSIPSTSREARRASRIALRTFWMPASHVCNCPSMDARLSARFCSVMSSTISMKPVGRLSGPMTGCALIRAENLRAVIAKAGGLGLLGFTGGEGEGARAMRTGSVPLFELPVALVAQHRDHRFCVQALVGPVDHDDVVVHGDEVHPGLGIGGGDPELLFVLLHGRPSCASARESLA